MGYAPARAGNPLENIAEPRTARRERLLAPGEVGALLKALAPPRKGEPEAPQIIAVIRAAILTGARISELLSLRWEDVRRDEMELHFRDTKTGFSRRPLSTDTLAVLDSVERVPGSPFVFRSIKSAIKPLRLQHRREGFPANCRGRRGQELHAAHDPPLVRDSDSEHVSNPRIGMALTGHKSHSPT